MRHLLLAATLALAAAPVAAQPDLPFSPAGTEACLLRAEGVLREVCVGLSAAACIDTPDGYTTVGMSTCLGKEAEYWDGRLNAAYQALLEVDGQVDAELAELGSAAAPMVPALREMQRAWIAFRDASCLYEYTQWGGGTGSGPASNECVMRITARQALALEDRLAQKQAQ
ncbi:lysozyme inhibitor LprI family protein [Palleronia sp. KMU-117]|uniref:lysozyme inhibitor LprI family protein n=1 Tax=Palleronia sp. KMU-117 TaxID=3434108 RepID=UPI003D73E597